MHPEDWYKLVVHNQVIVPVRGAGCIIRLFLLSRKTAVAVPVRGAGCIGKRVQTRMGIFVDLAQSHKNNITQKR